MTLHVRDATRADYPAVAAVMQAADPRRPVTAELLEVSAQKVRSSPRGLHLHQWVAERGGEVVGFAGVAQWAGAHHPDRYHAVITVPPGHARRGVGTALAGAVRAHLEARGAREVRAAAAEDQPHAVAFLTGRGFREVSREVDHVLTLDAHPAAEPDRARLPEGLRIVALPDFIAAQGRTAALEAFRATFNAARADEPRTVPAAPYTAEEIEEYLAHPLCLPEGMLLAVTGAGEVAGLTELWLDPAEPERLHTGLTGTARAWRGRGVATALKRAALEVARARDTREIWTQNDLTNAPMLAVNARLGFRPQPALIQFRLGEIGPADAEATYDE